MNINLFLTFFLCEGCQLLALDNLLLLRLLGLEILDPVLYCLLGPGQGLLLPADAAQELLVLPPPPLRLLRLAGRLLQLGLQVVHQAVHVGDTLLVRHLHTTVARAVNEPSRSFTVPREVAHLAGPHHVLQELHDAVHVAGVQDVLGQVRGRAARGQVVFTQSLTCKIYLIIYHYDVIIYLSCILHFSSSWPVSPLELYS